MREFLFFFISVMIIFSLIQKSTKSYEVETLVSQIDNRRYIVRKRDDSQQACDLLAQINKRIEILFSHLRNISQKREGVDTLLRRYNPDKLSETLQGEKYTSYSVNKGEQISLCLRYKDDSFININTIMFVVLHELAHVMTKEEGHTESFWANMKYLLEEGEKQKIYKPENYKKDPVNYCGMKIYSTPYDFKK